MDEKYLKDLYGLITKKDASFSSDVPYDVFVQKIQNPSYAKQMHDWIGSEDKQFLQDSPFDSFMSKIKSPAQIAQPVQEVKKKATALPVGIGSLESLKQQQEPELLKFGQGEQAMKPYVSPDGKKPKQPTQTEKVLNPLLETIDEKLVNENEGFVVPDLNYKFKDLGFKFEESGLTGDWVTVTAPNGKKKEIGLNPLFGIGAEGKANQLKEFIKENTPTTGLDNIERQYSDENKKFLNQKEVDDSIKTITDEATTLNLEQKEFLKNKAIVDSEFAKLNAVPEKNRDAKFFENYQAATQKKEELKSQYDILYEKTQLSKKKNEDLNKAVGKYTQAKSEQGSFIGWTRNLLLSGYDRMGAAASNLMIDLEGAFLPKGVFGNYESDALSIAKQNKIGEPSPGQTFDKWFATLTKQEQNTIDSGARDLAKKEMKKEIIPYVRKGNQIAFGDESTTTQFSDLAQEGFWGGAYAGVIQSLPAIAMPGSWAKRAAFFAQGFDSGMEEMEKNEAFKNISENEKGMYALPIGITNAVLEEFGVRNLVQSKGLLNNIVLRALKQSTENVTATSFKNLVENEIKSSLAKGTLTLVGGALAEAETGAVQQAADITSKSIYNYIKDRRDENGNYMKMFNTPDSISDFVKQVVVAGAQEAVGGLVMGMPNSVSSAYKKSGFLNMNDDMFKLFEAASNDDKIQSAFVASLKNQVNEGSITVQQAKETLNNYRSSIGLFRALPENLNTEGKKEAMNLLKEKRDLEQRIEGKDPALVKPQQNRINQINESLTKLSENAIQEQATDAGVLRNQQSEMGLQEVGEGNEKPQVPTTSTEEAITTPSTQEVIDAEDRRLQKATGTTQRAFSKALFDFFGLKSQEEYSSGVSIEEFFKSKIYQDNKDSIENGLRNTKTAKEDLSLFNLIPYYRDGKPFLQVGITTKDGANKILQPIPLELNEQLNNLGKETNDATDAYLNFSEEIRNNPQKVAEKLLAAQPTPTETVSSKTQEVATEKEVLGKGKEGRNNALDFPINKNGNEVGGVVISRRDGSGWSISNVRIEESEQRQGIGTQAYRELNKKSIEDTGYPLTSGVNLTNEAKGLWESLVKKGEAEKLNDETYQFKPTPTETVSSKTQETTPTPRLARDIGLLITPATVRGYDKFTKRIKKMSLKYDELVKKFNENKDPKIAKELKKLESQILDAAKKDILEDLSKIDGVAVRFRDAKRGLWEGKFEPSFNMELVISPQADTKKISDLLTNFAEKYSQDAFILETDSEYNEAVLTGQRDAPLTEFDENGLTHYPQIIYTFENPITDAEVAELSVRLQKNGIDAFNLNNNEVNVSVMKFFPDDTTLTENEQNEERKSDFRTKLESAKQAVDALGLDGNGKLDIRYRKSHYQGAINEKSPEQTRRYNRGNFLEAFQKGTTRVEGLAAELAKLREKQIELQNRGEQLSPQDKERFDKLNAEVQPTVQATFEANKKLYEDSKVEVEGIAARAIKGLKASLSPFFIKNPERASVKTIRWYGSFTEKLGDGSRVNVVVDTIEDADKVYAEIERQHPKDADIRRVNETTDLGYPKRLIEIRTSNGTISEIQVITKEAYLAKDGVKGFTGGDTQVESAKKKLKEIQKSLGWNIPDGLGHYFYEINRDVNVDQSLRDEAQRLSKLYYDAFTNPDSKLAESYMDDVIKFKEQVDAADKSDWDKGNNGKTPEPLADYISQTIISAPQGLSEAQLPGYDRMKSEVEGIISKSEKRGVDKAKTMDNVMQYVMKSKVYETATDIQREALVREVNKVFGVREKSGPSLSKLLNAVKDVTKITMTEKSLLVKQIKDLGRGAKDAVKASRLASEQLSKNIKELAASGRITPTQAANVLRAFSKVNVFSETSVRRFTDYMTKVFAKAEYAQSLRDAKSLKGDLLQLSKNQDKNANLRELAAKFCEIDPSMVEDIDAYNKMASEIKESIKGSTILGKKVKFAEIVNIENASKYIDDVMKAQRKTLLEYAAADFEDAMGVAADGLTYEDLMDLLDDTKPTKKYNESIVRSAIQRMFDINSSIIKSMLKTKTDAFTGEPVDFTKSQQDIISRFMDMDLSKLSAKEALQAADALGNFIQNKSTAKMDAVVSKYTGEQNINKVINKGIFAVQLRKYFSAPIGKLLAQQTTTLPALFEKMFKGVNRGGFVSDMIGVTKLISNKAFAEKEARNIVENYVKKFYNKKANGEAFNNQKNNVERGMASFMMRNIIGTEAEMKQEFERRRNLIEESIEVLSEGTEKEQARAELYAEAYDKIVKDSKNIQEIKDKTDATNLEAIEYWTNEWSGKYDELADVSLNVYNKVLGRDVNYNPDMFARLSDDIATVEIKNNESQFHNRNDNGNIYKKENGVLMIANRPEKLPVNENTKRTSRYIDLSFDNNNANSMHDALVDIRTAAAIRQIDAAVNSKNFKKVVPNADDAKILKERINLYVQNIRNKNMYSGSDELSKMIRKLNKVASIGVGQALGGVFQPFKQVIPVGFNTLLNAGSLNMGAMFDAAKLKFIAESGESIANRGIGSQAQIDSINKLIDEAAKSTPEKMINLVEKANEMWLNLLLVKPDLFIAKASWLTYYEKGLKKQGIDTKGLDYTTHVKNEEAAAYATRMVDRQQNISDADLGGKLFTDKDETKQIVLKTIMPFASFRLNQATRFANDLSTITNWNISTKEDKIIAARSLAGFGAEMVVFKTIAAGAAILMGNAVNFLMDKEEDEEEKKKRIANVVKGQATGAVTDILSPSPLVDKLVQGGVYKLTDVVQDFMDIADESKKNIYDVRWKEDLIKSLGLIGITADRINQVVTLATLSSSGKFKDDYGKVKYISQKDKETLKYLIVPALMSNFGLAPAEVNGVVKGSINKAKKGASTVVGGKSEEDFEVEESEKAESEIRKDKKEENKSNKIEALEKLKERTSNPEKISEIEDMISELSMTDEEKKETAKERKLSKKDEKEIYNALLEGYDTKEQLKRYAPAIYLRNFGPNSDYYKEHRTEDEIEKQVNKILKQEEDKEQNYISPTNVKKQKMSWRERAYRSVRGSGSGSGSKVNINKTVVDEDGNVISSYRKRKW